MPPGPENPESERFAPRATRTLGGMFDDVSGRYDLLNRLLTLDQDKAWRRAVWNAVPEEARVVLDLCTGSGVSLEGLRRPGRLVIGLDVSLGMLEVASRHQRAEGWAPRLVCGDAFRLPFADHSIDAVTVAFGIRNLRPIRDAAAEIARVLRPGGWFVILEATAPSPGPLAPFHRFHLRRVVPLLGRLSADPTAYRYLSDSILALAAADLEADLAAAGFATRDHRSFLLGASRLWSVRANGPTGQESTGGVPAAQYARPAPADRAKGPRPDLPGGGEWRIWTGVQLAVSAALTLALGYGLWVFLKFGDDLPLAPAHRVASRALLVLGSVGFLVRTVVLSLRFSSLPRRP
jgi:demethylmenaquinone methyltransferase/2-methoxy-6-polyprenyl-1,4-benzoquinol methylase